MEFDTSKLHPSSNGHCAQAIEHLGRMMSSGRPWADALLEAVGLWTSPAEEYQGRHFVYLIQGEAFDWLQLAERLLTEAPFERAPQEEQEHLLFHGELPSYVTAQRFRDCLGVAKYRAHLNFFYGVVVEEALMQAVEEEVLKEGGARGFVQGRGVDNVVAHRLYGDTYDALLQRFHREGKQRHHRTLSLSEWKAFIYWLFKWRLKWSDQARTASDTRKGLSYLSAIMPSLELGVTLPTPLLD